jgi:hypothetical protein
VNGRRSASFAVFQAAHGGLPPNLQMNVFHAPEEEQSAIWDELLAELERERSANA